MSTREASLDTAPQAPRVVQPAGGLRRPAIRPAPWALIGSLAMVAVFLLPARAAALRGDDQWTFGLKGLLALTHTSLLHQIGSDISWGIVNLRPQVLAKVTSDAALYYFVGHPALYRLLLVALTVGCAGLMWSLVRRLGGSTVTAVLTVVVFAGAVQFRSYHDAVLGYYGATQFALAFLLGSLLAFLAALRGGGWRWLLLSVILFACGCAMQEYIYPLALTHLGLAFAERRGRDAIRFALPVLVVGGALMVVGYLGRNGAASSADVVHAGYGTALNVRHVVKAYFDQLPPPFPGTYRLFGPGGAYYWYPLGSSLTPAEYFAGAWRGAVVFIAVAAALIMIGRRRTGDYRPGSGVAVRLLAVGVPMWLTPPILLAVSAKYQMELSPGKGYVDVLVQDVGVAFIISAALIALTGVARRRGRAVVLATALSAAAVLGFAAGVDGADNLRVVATEQPIRHTRDLLETAANKGVLNVVPAGSTLLFNSVDMNWPTGSWGLMPGAGSEILRADTGRSFDVRYAADQLRLGCAAGAGFPPPPCAPPQPSTAWVRVRARPGGGVVIVSQLVKPTSRTIESAAASRVWVFAEQSGDGPAPLPAVSGNLRNGHPWLPSSVRWLRLRAGSGWALYTATMSQSAAPVAYSLDYPLSPINFNAPETPDQLVRIYGVKHLLP